MISRFPMRRGERITASGRRPLRFIAWGMRHCLDVALCRDCTTNVLHALSMSEMEVWKQSRIRRAYQRKR